MVSILMSRVSYRRLVIIAVAVLIVIVVIAQRPIRQLWAVYALRAVVLDPTIDQGSPFTDVHYAVYAVVDLNASQLATPILAKAFKRNSVRSQMKILEALVMLRADISPAVPQLIEAFSDSKARDVDLECIAMLIECGDKATAEKCGASQYLRTRGKSNVLLELDAKQPKTTSSLGRQ